MEARAPPPPPVALLTPPQAKNPHARRDSLLAIQADAQAKWERERVFQCDAPAEGEEAQKFFGNFPYPYMNGLLHLGHAFSLSKVEFATAYQRLCGKHVLFPFAFHCTGMPIKAAADKIAREIALYGNPPVFPEAETGQEAEEAAAASAAAATQAAAQADPTVFKSKKSKAAAKTARAATQWEIMRLSGVAEEEIAAFAEPSHWLGYFPPLGARDVAALGCGVDWRRSFITTDANPYYDSFVRWQFNKLRALGKVVRDKRFAVFSPLDGQPCADHDRASGEGVGPQEYTMIKLEVLAECVERAGGPLAPLAGRKVCLGAATLRPETMYGQTNCWVLPDGVYGAFELDGPGGEVLVMTARAARNLSFQERMDCVPGSPVCLLEVSGAQLVGMKLRGPLSGHDVIYALPMLTIITTKGTGIVTSVPSDAPDDFMALSDLQAKPALRAKYGVEDAMVLPFAPLPTIHIPEFGDLAAPAVCAELKIKSQNDRALLDEAKHRTYLKGFTDGVMLVGKYQGRPVKEVKSLIRGELIAAGDALPYCEPERPVVSRSGDDCVVALTDQWYLQYGEAGWRERTALALSRMETVHPEARSQFEGTLGWLRQWACSRSFGLGTRFPWDTSFVIESLSDSTIYMAYYTVAHLLQGGDMYGQAAAAGGVDASALTDEVWEAVLLGGPAPPSFPAPLLAAMRREFEFWYPFDLRASGKDLIQNHLTFSLYNHTAIFPERHWPRCMRSNGHLLLNGDKMSKSTGNFKTLQDAVLEYGADAVRVALADAGDGMDDANFEESTANAAILRLTRELAWFEELKGAEAAALLRAADSPLVFADRVFGVEMDVCCGAARGAYEALSFRDALKACFFDLQNARDAYRVLAGVDGLHAALVTRFMDVSTRMLAPIAPHWAEHVWGKVLCQPGSVLKSGWPASSAPDASLRSAAAYLTETVADLRKSLAKASAPPKAPKGAAPSPAAAAPPPLTQLDVYVAPRYTGWRAACLGVLSAAYNPAANSFPPEAQLLAAVKESSGLDGGADKQVMKQVMPFLKFKMEEARTLGGARTLLPELPFDEAGVLSENSGYIQRSLGLQAVRVHVLASEAEVAQAPATARAADALPGKPATLYSS